MNAACREFRARLAQSLSGDATLQLSWHEHLLACGACRELLEQEHALEQLLASLPQPKLPPELARRVLAKLAPERTHEAALDRLLELSTAPAPVELARNVLAGLSNERDAARRERALDRLLERVPPPEIPAQLAARILAKARLERRRTQPLGNTRRLALAASLAVALGLGAWWLASRAPEPRNEVAEVDPADVRTTPFAADEPPAELLAALDLLESWEFVAGDDLDVQLNALDSVDELLLSLEPEAEAAPAGGEPKKG